MIVSVSAMLRPTYSTVPSAVSRLFTLVSVSLPASRMVPLLVAPAAAEKVRLWVLRTKTSPELTVRFVILMFVCSVTVLVVPPMTTLPKS